MEAFFQSDLKIWVVAAVLLIILSGLIFTLFRLDARVKRLESEKN